MTAFSFHRRFALAAAPLLFSALLVFAASNARAENRIYSFVDYPAYQTDNIAGGVDKISGTITTDGTTGQIDYTHLISAEFSITNPYTGVSYAPTVYLPDMQYLDASTPTLSVPVGDDIIVQFDNGGTPLLRYNHDPDPIYSWYSGYVEESQPPYVEINRFLSYAPILGGASTGDPWIIADGGHAVPEPGTLVLLASTLLGRAGAVCLRRRRAKA